MAKRENKTAAEHYVNNEDLLTAFIEYRKLVTEAEESGEDNPQVPEYIAECILKIATRLSYKSNFINYGFRDDMISDAVENCLTYINNFNPEKSKNPFAYFTQIIYYAFLRKIQKEKKQLYIRYKSLESSDIFGNIVFSEQGEDAQNISAIGIPKLYDNMQEFITSFEDSINNKKKQKIKKKKPKKLAANNLLRHIGEE